jgi:hypothetical protein
MNQQEHKDLAEAFLVKAKAGDLEDAPFYLGCAQVHATLSTVPDWPPQRLIMNPGIQIQDELLFKTDNTDARPCDCGACQVPAPESVQQWRSQLREAQRRGECGLD